MYPSSDAHLVIGGFPRLAQIWRHGESLWGFLRRELENPESPLVVLGERSLSAELPAELRAREVLSAIGAGERAFSAIMRQAQVSNKTLGSIKWREQARLDGGDIERLIAHREMLPGAYAHTLLVGVSRTGFATDRLDIALTAEEILEAGSPSTSPAF